MAKTQLGRLGPYLRIYKYLDQYRIEFKCLVGSLQSPDKLVWFEQHHQFHIDYVQGKKHILKQHLLRNLGRELNRFIIFYKYPKTLPEIEVYDNRFPIRYKDKVLTIEILREIINEYLAGQ